MLREIGLVVLILALIPIFQVLANYMYGIDMMPTVGISECAKFNETINVFNYSECKIYPGSEILIVNKFNPFGFEFKKSYISIKPLIAVFASMSFIFFVMSMIFLYYNKKKQLYISTAFFLISLILVYATSLVEGSKYGIGDIICYERNEDFICHTLIDYQNGKLITRGSGNIFNETISMDSVYGKVILRIPLIGAYNYALSTSISVFFKMLNIIGKGYYPLGVKIAYMGW